MIYVNDLFITGNHEGQISEIKSTLMKQYAMTYLGEIKRYLGVEFNRVPQGLFLHQQVYLEAILDEFDMADCRPWSLPLDAGAYLTEETGTPEVSASHYQKLVGKLIYALNTCLDLAFAVGQLSRYMAKPQQAHLDVGLQILQYIKGTLTHGLLYRRGYPVKLEGYTDATWGSSTDSFKSTGA
jgi:hypothetical protein